MTRSLRASSRPPSVLLLATSLVAAGSLAGASGGGSTSPAFQVRRTSVSVASGTVVALGGKNLAFLADEATTGAGGTDMNGDGDKIDSIAIAVNMSNHSQTDLDVAA